MKDIIRTITNLENMRSIGAASTEQIAKAEKELGVHFSKEYIEYVRTYGSISAKGIELTGVTSHERLNVVSATKRERDLNPNIPIDMYVIQNIGIDGLVVLQDKDGKMYLIAPSRTPWIICNSLTEYIESERWE